MPGLLQPRLSCFYCGSRSPHVKNGVTRQFTCQVCEATNHLDQKGDITDPPTTPAKAQTQTFAHARPKSASPANDFGDSNDSLFCKTCLKNQHFLTTCLAEYLPAEDDPEYEKYERQYPQYRKDLERRYPQVCAQCAPRAQARIHKTGYAAKVDFLTRNLERSKAYPVSSTSTATSFAILALNLVSMAWWTSMLLQALWHSFHLLGIPADPEQVANMNPLMLIGCSVTAARANYLPPGCSHLFSDTVRQSLQSTLLLSWWNPAIKAKLRSPARRYQWSGLGDFYRFQVLIFLVRLVAWWKLSRPPSGSAPADKIRALHGAALFFIVIGALASQRMVTYVSGPRISFKDTTAPLVEPGSDQYPAGASTSQPISRLHVSSLHSSPPRPFDIASLGPKRPLAQTHHLSPVSTFAAPPTPPPESVSSDQSDQLDAADFMDWEPLPQQSSPLLRRTQNASSNASFPAPSQSPLSNIPSFLRRPATASAGEKSPFTGRLPPAPISPAHRLRNPPPRPQFKPTPLSKQQDFFKQMGLSSTALPLPGRASASRSNGRRRPSSEDEREEMAEQRQTYVQRERDQDHFRPAQWTLKSDLDAAVTGTGTGLEDMFSTSFRLGDNTPTQTPRRNRRREVGGDGRELFESATAHTVEAARIIGSDLQLFFWPIVLALLALALAVARDPLARQWINDRIVEGLGVIKGF